MEAPIYNQEGKEVGKIDLPEKIFGLPWNADLVHQAVVTQEANNRKPVAHAKGRGEVRGGGKKPWKQKGTGRARHGSSRSPLWVGGGVTHGPTKEKVYAKKLNRKMKNKALATVLSAKAKDGKIIFLNALNFKAPRTKEAAGVLATLSKNLDKKELTYQKGKRVLLAVPTRNSAIEKSFRNIKVVGQEEVRNLSPLTLLAYQYVIFIEPEKCVEVLGKRI